MHNKQPIIEEHSDFFTYYQHHKDIIGVTKNEAKKIDNNLECFGHLKNIPDEITINACIFHFDSSRQIYCCPDTRSFKEIKIKELDFLFKNANTM